MLERNDVRYHDPVHRERLVIGKFCSIACGAKFMFNCANHSLRPLPNDTFPLVLGGAGSGPERSLAARGGKGYIVVGNGVWIGNRMVVMAIGSATAQSWRHGPSLRKTHLPIRSCVG